MNLNLMASFFENIAKIFTTQKYLSMILTGLETTIIVSLGAAVVGLLLGTIVAIVKILPQKNIVVKVANFLCNVYTTIIRGTPMALQLFIMAFIIFAIKGFPLTVTAILAFGINSGAYVSENIRAGILSVDKGQTEAGRALGLNGRQTMISIVIPQGMKNVIPAIGNELIALIKETSIVSMIGMFDLTQAAQVLGAGQNLATYFAPMVVVALFYLAIVYLLTLIIKLIERRLRKSDKR
ncbi:MAG: amino acid ABC transporter permease [Candidatus Coproplasma sp.]